MLIHIGYHKTASTWLQKVVFCEEHGFYQPVPMDVLYNLIIKPSCFEFDADKVRVDVNLYLSKTPSGMMPVLSHERFSGDPFTGSRDAKIIADRLYALYPQAKILIFVRNQIDMISSLYKTYVLHGGKASIREFLHPIENEVNQWFDKKSFRFHYLVQYYHQLLGPKRVLVMPFELLKQDNLLVFYRICEFSGVKGSVKLASNNKRVNVGLSDLSVELLRMANKLFSPFSEYGLDLFRIKTWRYFRSFIFRVDGVIKRFSKNDRIRRVVEQECLDFYSESNSILQEYIQYDLNELGYKCLEG